MRWRADIHALATCDNALFLGTFAAGAAILRNNVDSEVAQNIQQHGPYWGNASEVISHGGNSFTVQLPLIAGVYAMSLLHQDDDLHEFSLTLFSSFNFTLISSFSLQYVTGTHRSNSATFSAFGDSGFPSTPVATSFALAAVIEERYGWRCGVPAYLAAGLIGWSEVDQNQHTVSDVVFGAALGYAIGKSIGAMHYRPDSPFKLVPFTDPWSRSQGLGIERRF
jgi:membrane-associated phospholipid phosphatase